MLPAGPPLLAQALLRHLDRLGAKAGYWLYPRTVADWADELGLSAWDRDDAIKDCVENGWLAQPESVVDRAYVLTEAGLEELLRLRP